jgi:hypothetical protein
MLPGSGARICSKCGVTRVIGVTRNAKPLYLLILFELHRSGTPIFKRVTESIRVTVSDECRELQLVDRPLLMVHRR